MDIIDLIDAIADGITDEEIEARLRAVLLAYANPGDTPATGKGCERAGQAGREKG